MKKFLIHTPFGICYSHSQPQDEPVVIAPDIKIDSMFLDQVPVQKSIISPELQALVDRQEFLEDCIAEMASVIYSGEGGEES